MFISLAQRNLFPSFLWRKERSKETSTPTKSPPIWGDLTEKLQKPPAFRGFWYRGTRDCFLCCRAWWNYVHWVVDGGIEGTRDEGLFGCAVLFLRSFFLLD